MTKSTEDFELKPDAWSRFERFVKNIVKAGPQHSANKKVEVKQNRSTMNRESSKAHKGSGRRPSKGG
jgi:hypothetical protein